MSAKEFKSKYATPKESEILRDILKYLDNLGKTRHWRSNTGVATYNNKYGTQTVRYGVPGMTDIQGYFLRTGIALFIEVKRPGGKLTQLQFNFITNAKEANCISFVADSVDVVRDTLENINITDY